MSKILIGIPTYKRPDGLQRLLASIAHSTQHATNCYVLVVDNDPNGSAREVVRAINSGRLPVAYTREPRPGVVHVRNRILAESAGFEAVVFLDDDQVVSEEWWDAFLRAHMQFPKSVLAGDVQYSLERPVDDAYIDEWLDRRSVGPDFQMLSSTGTGNCLIPVSALALTSTSQFDPRFSVTGGEDVHFFNGLTSNGVEIRRCNGAVAIETVTSDRGTRAWIRSRLIREGATRAMMKQQMNGRPIILAEGIFRVLAGSAIWAAGAARRRRTSYSLESKPLGGLGYVIASLGLTVRQYGGSK